MENEELKSKMFESERSDLSVEVIENGWIIIRQDEVNISLGRIDGMRCKLIEDAFKYAKKLKGEKDAGKNKS